MKKNLVLGVIAVFLGASLALPANAAVKAGAKCTTKGQTTNSQGKKYTCIKSGKKLVWNKGVSAVKQSASSAVPSKSEVPAQAQNQTIKYSEPTRQSANIDLCKIKEKNSNRVNFVDSQLPTGFPGFTQATKTGTVKWALIPLDFPDLPGEANFRSRVDSQMRMVSDWFTTASEGKFKVEWVVADSWVRVSKPTSEYKIPRSENLEREPNAVKLWNDAITASDKVFDFTGIQTVNFILPKGQDFVLEGLQGFPWQPEVKNVKTSEGSVSSFSIPGKFFDSDNREYWPYFVHEFGHAMALPHVGSSRFPNPYLGLDIMGSQDGESRELSGWMRFVAGWLPDEKVYCQDSANLQSTELTLVPISGTDPGLKMAVVPLTETKALIIESRRENKFSCAMPSKRNGVLAYIYDATQSHGENFLKPVTPGGRSDESSSNCPVSPYPNPILYKGQEIVTDGVLIEILDSANYDKIRISRKS